MNTQEYIESGVLELYVSGLLSIEEMRDVELKSCQYPEVKTELQLYQSALERFAMNHAMTPRAELKDRVMKAIQSKNEGKSDMEAKSQGGVVRQLPSSKLAYSRLLAAASVVLLAVVSAIAFYFSSQYNAAKEQVAVLQQQQTDIQNRLDHMQTAMNENTNKMQLLTDANTVRVTMKGTPNSPESIALIYWNKETKAVYLDVKSLPPTPADKQYQLWFIDPQRGPISAGVFDLNTGELQKMLNATGAAAFAVTLEPRGGSVNPSLDKMYVIGNVTG